RRRRRYTPTRVGTTTCSSPITPPSSVHPHARGDDIPTVTNRVQDDGTPPRAWGRLAVSAVLAEFQRYTPTRVGTTKALDSIPTRIPVHPHARGDDSFNRGGGDHYCGTPPRAWGRLAFAVQALKACGTPPRAWGRRS